MQALEKAAWHQPSFWSLFLLVPPSLYSFTNFCFHLVDWECFFLSLLFWGGVGVCNVCECLSVCLCVGSRVCTCAETVATRYRLWHLFISSAQAGSLAEPRPHRLTPASTALGLSQGHASLPSMWVLWAWTPVLTHASMVRTLSTEPSSESPSLLSTNLSLKIFSPPRRHSNLWALKSRWLPYVLRVGVP